jgi:hypothetical protein
MRHATLIWINDAFSRKDIFGLYPRGEESMKELGTLAVALGAVVICATPVSLQWSSAKTPSLTLKRAEAEVGRPLTATSVAGVHRRVERRAYRRGAVAAGAVGAGAYYYGGAAAGADVGVPVPAPEQVDVGVPPPVSEQADVGVPPTAIQPQVPGPAIAPYPAPGYGYERGPYRAYGAPGYGYGPAPYPAYAGPGYGHGPGPYPAYGAPGYGYGPGPYPDTVIVNPVTGRWCRTEPSGHQWCWTP